MFGDQKVSNHWVGVAPNQTHRGRGTKSLYGFIVIHEWEQQGDTVLWKGFLDTEDPFQAVFPLSSCLGVCLHKKNPTNLQDTFINILLIFLHIYSMCSQGHWLWSEAPQRLLACVSMWERHGKMRRMSYRTVTLVYRKSQWTHPCAEANWGHNFQIQYPEETSCALCSSNLALLGKFNFTVGPLRQGWGVNLMFFCRSSGLYINVTSLSVLPFQRT